MAGRGTDIRLDEAVRENGGLHVIASELHSSTRIDRQLIGRCARQGDPGSYRFFLSLEDELLRVLPPEARQRLQQQAHPNSDGMLPPGWLRLFQKTQRMLERLHAKQRTELLNSEQHRLETCRRMGLDPCLDVPE